MKEYKVITKEEFVTAEFFNSLSMQDKIERTLNKFASQGWVLKQICFTKDFGTLSSKDEAIIILERDK